MSVIPLSIAQERGDMQTTSGRDSDDISADDYQHDQREAEDKQRDAIIDRSLGDWDEREKEAEQNRQAGKGRSLDEIIARNMDRAEAKAADERAFLASRQTRDDLNSRYRDHAPTTAKSLNMFLGWAEEFRRNPTMAADTFAQSYITRGPFVSPAKKDADAPAHGNKLDQVIADSIERAGSEKEEFKATAAQRAKLKEFWPHLSFDEALAAIAKIDYQMSRDPIGTAAVVAGMFNAPITNLQHQQAQVNASVSQAVAYADQGGVPALQNPAVRRVAAEQVLMSPYFRSSGNQVQDLATAASIAQRILQSGHVEHFATVNSRAFDPYRSGDLNRDLAVAGQMLYQQHAQTMAAIPGQIAAFERSHPDLPVYRTNMAILVASGKAHDLPTAYRMAKAERQSQQAAVSRAKRAAPVHASVGVGNTYGPKGLDAILGQAIERSGIS